MMFGSEFDLASGAVRVVPPCRAMRAALRQRTPVERNRRGDSALRELFSTTLDKMSGVRVSRDQVAISPEGSSLGLAAGMRHVQEVTDGRDIAVFTPSWFGYPQIAQEHGLNMSFWPLLAEDGYLPTAAALEEVIALTGAGSIVINNLATPTGAFLTQQRLSELADVLWKHRNIFVIEDALFLSTQFRGQFPLLLKSAPWLISQQRYLGTTSLTKGWAPRQNTVGFIWADVDTADAVSRMFRTRDHSTLQVRAARGALSDEGLKTPEAVKLALQENLAELLRLIASLRCPPPAAIPEGGTNVLWNVNAYQLTDDAFCGWVRRRTGVDLAPGYRFFAPGHVRVNLGGATPADFRRACERLHDLLEPVDPSQ